MREQQRDEAHQGQQKPPGREKLSLPGQPRHQQGRTERRGSGAAKTDMLSGLLHDCCVALFQPP